MLCGWAMMAPQPTRALAHADRHAACPTASSSTECMGGFPASCAAQRRVLPTDSMFSGGNQHFVVSSPTAEDAATHLLVNSRRRADGAQRIRRLPQGVDFTPGRLHKNGVLKMSATLRPTARVTFSLHWHRSSLRVPTTAGWLSTKLLPGMQLAHTALAAHAAPRSARPGAQPAWDGCLAHLCPGRQDHTRGEPGQRPAQGCRVSGVPAPAACLAACTRARRSTPAQLPTPGGMSGVARGLPPPACFACRSAFGC